MSSLSSAASSTATTLLWRVKDGYAIIGLGEGPSLPVPNSPHQIESQSIEEEASSSIPESVLRYERQLRKAQHAKKAGAVLPSQELDVVYKDDSMVVVNKPPGVLTVPGINSNASILDLVHAKFATTTIQDPANMIVHRLDMDTSGLVVFGRTVEVTKKLHVIFRERTVHKEYQALVMGHVPVQAGKIDLPLQRDHAHPPFMRISTPESEVAAQQALQDLHTHGWKKLVRKKPKPSQTEFQVLERGFALGEEGDNLPFTRLQLKPITGRTHQLRVHCAALGFPIIGDPTYSLFGEACPVGGLQSVPVFCDDSTITVQPCFIPVQQAWTKKHPPNEKPMCLHAALLGFEHPVTNEFRTFRVEPAF